MTNWLSFHIYFKNSCEALLIHHLDPFVQKLRKEKMIEQFFFIRYWENGAHIRLRLKVKKEYESLVRGKTNFYFSANPELDSFQITIMEASYEPETKRYGGPAAIWIAEQHFQHSSEVVLELLKSNKPWDYTKTLGASIQLHTCFVKAVGMKGEEACSFFSFLENIWLNKLLSTSSDSLLSVESIRNTFEKSFVQSEEMIVAFVQHLWNGVEDTSGMEEKWIKKWFAYSVETNVELKKLQESGEFYPPYTISLPYETIVSEALARWTVYSSYIHMTSNRLGVLNHDEAYLGYILNRALNKSIP